MESEKALCMPDMIENLSEKHKFITGFSRPKKISGNVLYLWKCKELFRRDINIDLKKRMLYCYVKSVMSYGCETWTYSKIVQNKIDAFQLWCYRRMLKIRYTDHVTNTRVK